MKVAVLGGGVVGIATAYYLAEDGNEVTVIERHGKAALETSFGNAGLYTPSDSYAWASPDALRLAIKSLYRSDLGIRYKLRLDPRLWLWSLKFLSECTHARALRNTLIKLRVASYSKDCLNALVAKTGIEYDGLAKGVLYFFRSRASLEAARKHMRILSDHGLHLDIVDPVQAMRIEPALAAAASAIAGGIYSPDCQTGDPHKFSNRLAEWCTTHAGVRFLWSHTVRTLVREGNRIISAATDKGSIAADVFVLAAGAESVFLSEPLGVRLPIYPVKGFSITAPIRDGSAAPTTGIVDEDRLVAFSRLGDRLRVASSAVFAGYDRSHRPQDFNTILTTAKELFPKGALYEEAGYWAGLRPMTPSSVPILGRARFDNLFLNTGHGHVGWTMSCGTGKFVADCVAGRVPEIESKGLLYGE